MLKVTGSGDSPSGVVLKQAAALLDHENFLVARRAYWFLEDQKLTDDQQGRLEAFRAKYEDRL